MFVASRCFIPLDEDNSDLTTYVKDLNAKEAEYYSAALAAAAASS